MSKKITTDWESLDGRMIVLRDEGAEKTKGGILIPGVAKETQTTGVVMHVGVGRLLDNGKRESMDLVKGDIVSFNSYAGIKDQKNKRILFMRQEEVLARKKRKAKKKK